MVSGVLSSKTSEELKGWLNKMRKLRLKSVVGGILIVGPIIEHIFHTSNLLTPVIYDITLSTIMKLLVVLRYC